MWYRRRPYWRRRGIWGFPFMLFFFILIFSHSWSLFLIGIVISIILSLFIRSIMAGAFGAGRPNTPPTWQQPYQQQAPYQQQTPYYQPSTPAGQEQPAQPSEYRAQPEQPYYQPTQAQEPYYRPTQAQQQPEQMPPMQQ